MRGFTLLWLARRDALVTRAQTSNPSFWRSVATLVLAIVAISAVILPARPATAAVGINKQISFQGKLVNTNGTNIADGTYNLEFKIYTGGAGTAAGNPGGSLVWTEDRLISAANGITVSNGIFQVNLGSVTALPASFNNDTVWLSIQLGSTSTCTITTTFTANCGGDGEMLPMVRFTAAPYALNSDNLGGIASTGFVQLGQGSVQAVSTATSAIAVNQTSTGNLLQLQSAGTDAFTLTSAGNQIFGNNAAHTISVTAPTANVAGLNLTVSASAGGAGASVAAGGNLVLQGGAGGGTNSAGGNTTINGGIGSGTGAKGFVVLQGSGGNVGIGISGTPAQLLSVGGTTGNLQVNTNGSLTIAQAAVAGGQTALKVTAGAHTAITTEAIDLQVAAHTNTITGGYATQRFSLFEQPTITSGSALTVTNSATVAIAGAPIKAGSAILTNAYGLLIQSGAVGAATNSYGLGVNAQTGATNNYAATFLGGNVGIGTATPTASLNVVGPNSALINGNAITVLQVTGGSGGVGDTDAFGGGGTCGFVACNGGLGSAVNLTGGTGGAGGTEFDGTFINADGGSGGNISLQGGAGGAAGTGGASGGAVGAYGNILLNSSGGNVGIGTASPTAKLHVSSALASQALFRVTDATASAVDVLNIADEGATIFKNRTNSTTAFQVQNAAGASIFNIDTANAKIGTAPTTGASTNSAVLTIGSGSASGTTSNSGNVVIDSGTATGTAGNITIGTGAYAHNTTIGNTTGNSSLTLQAGSGGIALNGATNVNSTLSVGGIGGNTGAVLGDLIVNRSTTGGCTVAPGCGAIFFGNSANAHYQLYNGTYFQLTDPLVISGAASYLTVQGNGASTVAGSLAVGVNATAAATVKLESVGTTSIASQTGQLGVTDTTTAAAGVGGLINFRGNYTGTSPTEFAAIQGFKENGVAGDYGGALSFLTRTNGSPYSERLRISSTGNVGIGQPTPTRPLHVSSAAPDVSNSAIILVDGNLSSTINNQNALRIAPNINPASASAITYQGVQAVPVSNSTNISNATVRGFSSQPYIYGSAVIGSSGALQAGYFQNQVDNTANVDNATGIFVATPFKAAGATITNNTGIRINDQTSGTNNIGLIVGEATGTNQTNVLIGTNVQPTGSYSIYNSSADQNYFAGNLGVGNVSPAAQLHVSSASVGAALFRVTDATATAADVLNIADEGATTFKNRTDSALAFQIQSASAAQTLLSANTVIRAAGTAGNLVVIGDGTGTDIDTTILKVDSATADPTTNLASLNGGLFYNSTGGKLKVIENGVVKTLCNTTDLGCGTGGGGTTLQGAYTASTGGTTPEILLDNTRNGLDIQDANTTIGATASLLAVRASATATTLGASLFTVRGDGNVGIGTASPSSILHVVGPNATGNGVSAIQTLQVTGGNGSAGTNNVTDGGTGSLISLTSGNGGGGFSDVSYPSFGGNGGNFTLNTGTGGTGGNEDGNCSGACPGASGGNGGNITLSANTGGNGGTGSTGPSGDFGGTGGVGGSITLQGGAGGTGGTGGLGNGANGARGRVTLQASGGNVGIGTATPTRTLDVTGSWGGDQYTRATDTTNANTTYADTTTGHLVYYLSSNKAATNSSATATYNLTGLPAVNGTFVFITAKASHNASIGASAQQCVAVQINGTAVTNATAVCDTAGNTASSVFESFIAARVNGTWMAMGAKATGTSLSQADLAEWISYTGTQPTAGEVLVLGDSPVTAKQSNSANSPTILGVVSTTPHTVLGADDGHSVILALTGRVPVKVNLEGGPIQAGDKLTSSSVPGVAMKATAAGQVIGTALASYDGTQRTATVMTQLSVGYYSPPATNTDIQGNNATLNTLNVSGEATVGSLVVVGTTTTKDLVVTASATIQNLTVVDAIKTKDLTVTGITTVAVLRVSGSAEFAGDIKLANGVGNTRNAITKKFKASKPIPAGSVVVADAANDGQVTTTTIKADRKVLGIAASTAASAGDEIEVAIGGTLQVRLDTANNTISTTAGDLLISSNNEGLASIAPEIVNVGTVLGKATSKVDASGLVWIVVSLQ